MNHFQLHKSNVENAQGRVYSDLEFARLLMTAENPETLPELVTLSEFLEEIRSCPPYLILVSVAQYAWIRRLGRNTLILVPSSDPGRKSGDPYVELKNRFYEEDGYGNAEVYLAYFGAEAASGTFCTFVSHEGEVKHYRFECSF